MENQILRVENQTYKSVLATENEFWMTNRKVNTHEEFQEIIGKKNNLRTQSLNIPYKDVVTVTFNNAGEYVFIEYLNDSGKKKQESMGFGDGEMAESFTNFIGTKMGLTKTESTESKIGPLLSNIFYVIMAGGATFLFGILWDEEDMSGGGSRKSRGGKAIMRMAYEYVGQTGILIIGSLLTLFMIYLLVKRLTKPAKVLLYSK